MDNKDIEYIKYEIKRIHDFAVKKGFKCNYSTGGGQTFSGGLVNIDSEGNWNQLKESVLERSWSAINFKCILKDTDYGDKVNWIDDTAQGLLDHFNEEKD